MDNDESFNVYEEVNEQFGTSDFVIVAAQSQNLFSQKKLSELQVLKEKIENISEIESVISILDAPIFMQPKVSLFKSASNDKYLLQDEIDLKLAQEEISQLESNESFLALDATEQKIKVDQKKKCWKDK